jgi:hypothetical protein
MLNSMRIAGAAVMLMVSSIVGAEAETRSLHAELEPFRPLLGKTWSGAFPERPDGTSMVDVVRYERVLNGMAVRAVHSINDGVYGGETLFRWDAIGEQLVFHYFTTQGFVTKGVIRRNDDGSFTSIEDVENPAQADGVTRVEAEFRIEAERLVVASTYFRGDTSEPGHAAVYRPTSERDVVFQ